MTALTRVALLLPIAALVCAGCREQEQPEPIRPVRAVKVGDVRAVAGREFPGRASAKNEVDLSFQVSGTLNSLPVDVGSELKKGEVVAALDLRDFQSALESDQANLQRARANLLAMERGARPEEIEQLKAAVAEAKASHRQALAEHERNVRLLPTGAVTQSDVDLTLARRDRTAAQITTAEENLKIGVAGAREEDLAAKRAEIKALEAAVAIAETQLDYAVLKAPFDGRVAARYVDNFQTVQAKQPVVRLLDVSKIEVTIQAPESLISVIPKVKAVLCRFDAFPEREFPGRITKIGSEASLTTRTYPVTIEVSQPEDVEILPGMAATVCKDPNDQPGELEGDPTGELVVPAGAVFTADASGQSFVWVVDEGSSKVSRREVQNGGLATGGRVVTRGIERGEWVVYAGVHSLREGQQVRILEVEGQ